MIRSQNERFKGSLSALAEYFHFSLYLIPPGGTVDVIASGFRLEGRGAQANTLAELRGWTQFIGLQIKYSLIERTVKRELIPMSKSLNLGVLAWSPLAKGVLSGKYHGEGKANGGRMSNEGMKEFVPEEQHTTRIISAVKAVSKPNGGCCRIGPALAEIVARSRRVP